MTPDELIAGVRTWIAEYERRGAAEQTLESFVASLRAERNQAQSENAELRAEIADLQAQLAALQHPLPQPEPVPTPRRKLMYPPPVLVDPITIIIDQPGTLKLNPDRDYILHCPNTLGGALAIVGGRNVAAIGGHVRIPHQGANPTINQRRGLLIRDTQGVFHGEGWWFDGEDISEGIQIDAPAATVQLQNIRIDHVHARDQVTFKDNHPDLVQTWGNVRELRIDGFTGSTDYQGFLLKADYNNANGHGAVTLSRVNIAADPTGRYLLWIHPSANAAPVTLTDVWLAVHPSRAGGLGKSVWTDVDNTTSPALVETVDGKQTARWGEQSRPQIVGVVSEGTPPEGDFVPVGLAGVGYVSPGYVSEA